MVRSAFLSVRVPPATRNRVKAIAATRGQTVQGLVGELVDRFLDEHDRRPLALAEVIARLRAREAELRTRGVVSLSVFGSAARGDAKPDSVVDLTAEFDPAVRKSPACLTALRANLSEAIGAPANLVEWSVLHAQADATAAREAVRVF